MEANLFRLRNGCRPSTAKKWYWCEKVAFVYLLAKKSRAVLASSQSEIRRCLDGGTCLRGATKRKGIGLGTSYRWSTIGRLGMKRSVSAWVFDASTRRKEAGEEIYASPA